MTGEQIEEVDGEQSKGSQTIRSDANVPSGYQHTSVSESTAISMRDDRVHSLEAVGSNNQSYENPISSSSSSGATRSG